MKRPAKVSSPSDSYWTTGILFALGGLVTAVFSGSLARTGARASFAEVLAVGMVVPSFTWVVQLVAAVVGLGPDSRRVYCGSLGRACLLGSVALMPAALFNFTVAAPPLWPSIVNVLASALLMAAVLFRSAARDRLSPLWPASWCVTIAVNMALFVWCSRHWWPNP